MPNNDDAFVKHKMPKRITETDGHGNETKMNIVDMVDIAMT